MSAMYVLEARRLGTNLFANHIDRVLNTAIWDHRDDRSICNPQIAYSMNSQLGVNNTLVDALRQACRTAWIYEVNR